MTVEITDEALANIEAKAIAATGGPWIVADQGDPNRFDVAAGEAYIASGSYTEDGKYEPACGKNNAEYIAAADPDTVLALVSEIRRLRGTYTAEPGVPSCGECGHPETVHILAHRGVRSFCVDRDCDCNLFVTELYL